MESTLNLLVKTEDDLLTCPICLMSFNCPKIIACLHTFCLPCISKHQVASGLMTEERMLVTVAEQDRRTWWRIQEQLPEHEEPLTESYGEPQETRREEGAEYQLHRQVDNEEQRQQQQQQQQLQHQQQQQLQQPQQQQQQQPQQQQLQQQQLHQQQSQQRQRQQQRQQEQQHQQQLQQQQEQQQQQFICCPICRQLTALPARGLLGLRNDFRLESMSKCLQAIRSQCTFSQLSRDCPECHVIDTSRNPSAANTPLLDNSTSSISDKRHQTKISWQGRICEVDERSMPKSRSRAPSTKVRKSRWKCIVRSFNKCLSSSCIFDEDFTEVLSCK